MTNSELCSRCKEPSAHAILVRKGDLPDPKDPKGKAKDKSGMYAIRFCELHWGPVKEILTT